MSVKPAGKKEKLVLVEAAPQDPKEKIKKKNLVIERRIKHIQKNVEKQEELNAKIDTQMVQKIVNKEHYISQSAKQKHRRNTMQHEHVQKNRNLIEEERNEAMLILEMELREDVKRHEENNWTHVPNSSKRERRMKKKKNAVVESNGEAPATVDELQEGEEGGGKKKNSGNQKAVTPRYNKSPTYQSNLHYMKNNVPTQRIDSGLLVLPPLQQTPRQQSENRNFPTLLTSAAKVALQGMEE